MSDVQNLGNFTRPVLICGGAYGNLEALEAVLARAQGLDIAPQRIIHSGDAAAYCADGAAAAALLSTAGVHCLMGNVEQQLASGAEDCGCGVEQGTSCDILSASWYDHARASVPDELKSWMGQLPLQMRLTMQGKSLLVVHGALSRINKFMFASHGDERFESEMAATDCDGVIAGHSGLPFTRNVAGRIWHNSGALGLPANDGTARVWYSVLEPMENGIRICHHPLDYPHALAADKMARAGLAPDYARALGNGLWPGVDVLPAPERQVSGQALAGLSLLWRDDGGLDVIEQSGRAHV